jgi:hypothetical protein
MNERRRTDHPDSADLEMLSGYVAGELQEDERTRVGEHLAVCAACRLECGGLVRFMALEEDCELAAEARWDHARNVLDARLATLNMPAERREADRPVQAAAGAGRGRDSRRSTWWIPVVAAAAMIMIVVGVERADRSGIAPEGMRGPTVMDEAVPFRGGETTKMALVPQHPVGEVAAVPDTFIWTGAPRCNRYTLEIYTVDLRTVYYHNRIEAAFLEFPDSLQALLQRDKTYFWNVQGFEDLDFVGAAPEVWFRIVR